MSEVYESDAGGVQVLHALATTTEPKTPQELAEDLDAAEKNVQGTLTRLYRTGYVVRRKRETGEFGANPYEYAVYQPKGESNE